MAHSFTKTVEVETEIDDDDIEDYLERHPDFLVDKITDGMLDDHLEQNPELVERFANSSGRVVASLPVSDRTDESPIREMIEHYGASKTLLDAHAGHAGQWRCRAWRGTQCVEGVATTRSLAAARCLVDFLKLIGGAKAIA